MSYASLLYAGDMIDPENGRFYQSMQETVTEISSHLLFFALELNRVPDRELEAKTKASTKLQRYAPWLRDTRAFRPFQLDDALEKLLHEKRVTGRSSWNRLFDETMAELTFEVDLPKGVQTMSSAEVLNLLSDRDGDVRKAAAKGLGKGLGENSQTDFSVWSPWAGGWPVVGGRRRGWVPGGDPHCLAGKRAARTGEGPVGPAPARTACWCPSCWRSAARVAAGGRSAGAALSCSAW